MTMHMQLWRGCPMVLALWLALGTGARADDPKSDLKKQALKGEHQAGDQHPPKGPVKPEAMKPGEHAGKHEGQEHMKAARAVRAEGKMAEGKMAEGKMAEGKMAEGKMAAERVAGTPEPSTEAAGSTEQGGERTRAERGKQARKRAWVALKRHFAKPQEIPPDIRNELQHHARRVARLQRIQTLAKAAGDEKTLARVDKLLARENQRHDKKLETQSSAQAKTTANDDKEAAAKPAPAAAAAEAAKKQGAEP